MNTEVCLCFSGFVNIWGVILEELSLIFFCNIIPLEFLVIEVDIIVICACLLGKRTNFCRVVLLRAEDNHTRSLCTFLTPAVSFWKYHRCRYMYLEFC